MAEFGRQPPTLQDEKSLIEDSCDKKISAELRDNELLRTSD